MTKFTVRYPRRGLFCHPALWLESQGSGLTLYLSEREVDNLAQWLNRVTDEEHKALVEALLRLAGNYDYRDDQELCWCRHVDGTINPRCEDQEQCTRARAALGLVRGEGDE